MTWIPAEQKRPEASLSLQPEMLVAFGKRWGMCEGRYGIYFESRALQCSHAVQVWEMTITHGVGADMSSASQAGGWPFPPELGNLGVGGEESGFDPAEV